MYCAECGATLPEHAAACPFCGTQANAPARDAPREVSPEVLAERAFEASLYRWPWITACLLGVCLSLCLGMEWVGSSEDPLFLIAFGAKDRSLILGGELWRLISASFLHIGYTHLLFNTIALVQLGLFCENIFGRTRFLLLYLLSGVGGFALAAGLSQAVSAGASASLFGLMGAMLVFGWRHRKEMPPFFHRLFTWMLLPWVLLNLLVGRFVANVDNYAHVGGLLAGLALAAVLDNRILKSGPTPGRRTLILGGLSAALLASAAWGVGRALPENLARIDTLERAADLGDGDAFSEAMTTLIETHPDAGIFYAHRAEGFVAQGDIPQAEADLRTALGLDHSPGATKNRLSWMLLTHGDASPRTLRSALELARQSVGLSKNPGNLNTLGYALLLNAQPAQAKARLEQALARNEASGVWASLQAQWDALLGRPPREEGSPFDLLMLALTLERLGDHRGAQTYLARGEAAAALTIGALRETTLPRPAPGPLERLTGEDVPAVDRLIALDELSILDDLLEDARDAVEGEAPEGDAPPGG